MKQLLVLSGLALLLASCGKKTCAELIQEGENKIQNALNSGDITEVRKICNDYEGKSCKDSGSGQDAQLVITGGACNL